MALLSLNVTLKLYKVVSAVYENLQLRARAHKHSKSPGCLELSDGKKFLRLISSFHNLLRAGNF